MNTQSVDCRRITDLPLPAGSKTQPGDFAWDDEWYPEPPAGDTTSAHRILFVHLPGDQSWTALPVRKGDPGGNRVWGWDGNEDKPTITPSIHWLEHWHGYLTNGRLISC